MAISFRNVSGSDLVVQNLTMISPTTPATGDGIHTNNATVDYSLSFTFGELQRNQQIAGFITAGSLVIVIGPTQLTALQTQNTWDLGPFFWAILTSESFRTYLGNSNEFDAVVQSAVDNLTTAGSLPLLRNSTFELNGTVEISANVSITTANLADYNNKLWIIIGPPGTKTVTVADNLDGFNYFGVFVRGGTATLVITQATGGSITFNDRADVTFTNRQATIFARVSNQRFFEVSNNAEGLQASDGVVIGATISGNTLTLDRSGELADITVMLPSGGTGATTFAATDRHRRRLRHGRTDTRC